MTVNSAAQSGQQGPKRVVVWWGLALLCSTAGAAAIGGAVAEWPYQVDWALLILAGAWLLFSAAYLCYRRAVGNDLPFVLQGTGNPSSVKLRPVPIGDESRRMAVIPKPPNGLWAFIIPPLILAGVVLLRGHGGFDGAFGLVVALVVLLLGTVVLQAIISPKVPFAFDPEGIYDSEQGWIPWKAVTEIQVRRYRGGGGEAAVWIAFERSDGEAWVRVHPGWGVKRVGLLVDRLEHLWDQAKNRRTKPKRGAKQSAPREFAGGDGTPPAGTPATPHRSR